jgi:hypothetical protein
MDRERPMDRDHPSARSRAAERERDRPMDRDRHADWERKPEPHTDRARTPERDRDRELEREPERRSERSHRARSRNRGSDDRDLHEHTGAEYDWSPLEDWGEDSDELTEWAEPDRGPRRGGDRDEDRMIPRQRRSVEHDGYRPDSWR